MSDNNEESQQLYGHKTERHFMWNSRFCNPWPFNLPHPLRFLLYLLSPSQLFTQRVPSQQVLDEQLPVRKPDFTQIPPEGQVSVTWLGHASCLFTFGQSGVRVLCDPLLSERASPVGWAGPRRHRRQPCDTNELPSVTCVCLSHNHFDHTDSRTLAKLCQLQPNVKFFVPQGDRRLLVSLGANAERVQEMLWWQTEEMELPSGKKLSITFTPASHWSGRGVFDKNASLWGSFVVSFEGKTVFFAGDTGYVEMEKIFHTIGARYGPMDLSAIPIGAYCPREIFQAQHVSPKEAVLIHNEVKSKKSLGIHWGTFNLSTLEGFLQPRDDLDREAKDCDPGTEFVTVNPGETLVSD